ncbi:MAG: CoA-binding protein [Dehalococcoidales bacterium]|nr:CoA-binding protein [Dehalococcoidales bacterium]
MSGNRLEEFAPVFYPKSHAVIGASASERKFGGRFLKTLLNFGYSGKVYPVNPQESEVLGLKTYARVGDIPEPVEFASIAVPARAVPGVVEECLAKGVKAVQILSAGFRELGEEGARMERDLASMAARGLRIVGPNCFGVYCPGGGMTILPGENLSRETGPVGFISQSGGYAVRVPRRADGLGIRFSKAVSYGNACDINECDLLEYFLEDPETDIITGYLEGVRDGPRFFRVLKEVCRTKPVIIWKGGLTQGGARAAQSHTASLSGEEVIWEAVFRQTGAIQVNNLEELLDTTLAFIHLEPQMGRRMCSVGGGGGIGVAAADTWERAGLSVPLFPPELEKKLLAIIPAVGASAKNPVDVGGPFPMPPMLRAVLETVCTDADIDILVVDEIEMASALPGSKQQFRPPELLGETMQIPLDIKNRFGKPVVIVMPVEAVSTDSLESEGERRKIRDFYLQNGIPVYLTKERAAKALANLTGYYRHRNTVLS